MKTEYRPTPATAAKQPQTRMLDMLVGWAEFVYSQEDEHADSLTGDAIYDLYNEFAGTLAEYEAKTPEECERLARIFMEDRVIPMILRER